MQINGEMLEVLKKVTEFWEKVEEVGEIDGGAGG
jgi:hypothetical protein